MTQLTQHTAQVMNLLTQLERSLIDANLWQPQEPSAQSLASKEPFAIDTLTPQQWLQWIFIPKLTLLIKQNQPLPQGFAIAAYFEQAWQAMPDYQAVLTIISELDKVFASC